MATVDRPVVGSFAFALNGARVLVKGVDPTIFSWPELRQLETYERGCGLTVSVPEEDSRHVLTYTASADREIQLVDLTTVERTVIGETDNHSAPQLEFPPDINASLLLHEARFDDISPA